MKVNKAKQLWSRNVSNAMKFYAKEKGKNEFNTTAAFIEIISKWFTLITARTPRVALGKTSSNEDKEKIQFKYCISSIYHRIISRHKNWSEINI